MKVVKAFEWNHKNHFNLKQYQTKEDKHTG
jgi:hypothetical protein